MFAVPGWSVPADKLKAETAPGRGAPAPAAPKPTAEADGQPQDRSKKRKRQERNVTAENVADLWERVIEGKSAKKHQQGKPSEGFGGKSTEDGVADDAAPRFKKKTLKEKKREKKLREKLANGEGQPAQPSTETPEKKKKRERKEKKTPADEPETKTQSAPAPAPKLTPLQASMRNKLVSARFRHLNETLYTKPSLDSFKLFEDSPEMFQEYHEGFRRQVEVWPENPVDGYISDLKERGKQRQPPKGRNAPPNAVAYLPRTNGICTIADLGCGDAKLAESLQSEKKKLGLKILSYDLQSPSPLVIKADIANLPLEDGSVNVAVFCLALMGTNWLDFIEEAYRLLHWKGELWIAEIKSRFTPVGKGKNTPVTHSVGNRKKNLADKKGKGKAGAAGDFIDETDLAVEIDGVDDKRGETDVSAFVEALKKRGFLLQGEGKETVDLSNKMFVKMHFIKAAPPVVGKGAVAQKESGRPLGKKQAKFIDAVEDHKVADETSILKPCVYKIR